MPDNDPSTSERERVASAETSVGASLKAARRAQDLALEQISAELRIARPCLEALEADRFEQLGPPVFAKGYLKQYGRRLGLDCEALLAQYQRQGEDRDVFISPPQPIRLRDERQVTLVVLAVVGLILLGAGLGVWWWGGGRSRSPGVLAAPAAGPRESGAPVHAGATATTIQSAPSSEPSAESADRQAAAPRAEAAPAPAALERAERAAGEPSADEPVIPRDSAAAGGEAAASAASEAPSGAGLAVRIVFEQDCWTEVTDADERRLYYGLGRAGSELELSGVAPLRFFLGNADGVRLEVDGMPYPLPARGRRGKLANFSVASPEH